MKTLIIKSSKATTTILRNIPNDVPTYKLVEKWQKNTLYHERTGRLTPCTYQIIENVGIGAALAASVL